MVNPSTSGTARSTQVAVNQVVNNPSAINQLTVYSINVIDKTYYASSSDSSSSSSYSQGSNIGLIVGLCVGLIGGALVIFGSIIGYRNHKKKQRGRRLINDGPHVENPSSNQLKGNNVNPSAPYNNNDMRMTRRVSVTSPDLTSLNKDRLHSLLTNSTVETRVPSAAMSVTTLGDLAPFNQQFPSQSTPTAHLIRFD